METCFGFASTRIIRMKSAWLVALVAGGLIFATPEPLRSQDAALPWKTNDPIVEVKKEIYRKHGPKGAALAYVWYVGPKLERLEIASVEATDDVHSDHVRRFSSDNGRTWSPFPAVPNNDVQYEGKTVWEGDGHPFYDRQAGVLIEPWLRQIVVGGIYNGFTYYRLSRDYGKTWSAPKQFKYEDGPDFDPKDPHNPAFIAVNQGHLGNTIIQHSNGTLIHPLMLANAPDDPDNATRPWKMGSLCMVGRWNPSMEDYDWKAGKRVQISPEVSGRGLLEPEAAELADERVLVVYRTNSGHMYHSVSSDGGLTLSNPAELKYDDGTSFHAPSAYHRMLRHSQTGKLYWFGNISATKPDGNTPRYPLVIAEVDETIPALKKKTVSVIDDRRPDQPGGIQLSNFQVIEDRESHQLELYLTIYGEDATNAYHANAYKYIAKLK